MAHWISRSDRVVCLHGTTLGRLLDLRGVPARSGPLEREQVQRNAPRGAETPPLPAEWRCVLMKRLRVVLFLFVFVLLAAPGAAHATGTLDQSQTTIDGSLV